MALAQDHTASEYSVNISSMQLALPAGMVEGAGQGLPAGQAQSWNPSLVSLAQKTSMSS